MRSWISFRTGIRGVRVGLALPNSTARIYPMSPTGLKIFRIGSAVMLIGLAAWLFFSRSDDDRLNEYFWLMIALVLALRYIFKVTVAALWPPIETPPQ
jgi:hypothetical protein